MRFARLLTRRPTYISKACIEQGESSSTVSPALTLHLESKSQSPGQTYSLVESCNHFRHSLFYRTKLRIPMSRSVSDRSATKAERYASCFSSSSNLVAIFCK